MGGVRAYILYIPFTYLHIAIYIYMYICIYLEGVSTYIISKDRGEITSNILNMKAFSYVHIAYLYSYSMGKYLQTYL